MDQLALIEHLLDREVPFVLVGGMAAVAHGSPQLTQDLDICVPVTARSFLVIQSALEPLHPFARVGNKRIPLDLDESRAARLKNLYLVTDLGNIDCLGDVAGVGNYEAALAWSIDLVIDGRTCKVLSLEALIRSKEAMGRPRDLISAAELRAIRERTSQKPRGG